MAAHTAWNSRDIWFELSAQSQAVGRILRVTARRFSTSPTALEQRG